MHKNTTCDGHHVDGKSGSPKAKQVSQEGGDGTCIHVTRQDRRLYNKDSYNYSCQHKHKIHPNKNKNAHQPISNMSPQGTKINYIGTQQQKFRNFTKGQEKNEHI